MVNIWIELSKKHDLINVISPRNEKVQQKKHMCQLCAIKKNYVSTSGVL